MSQKCGACGSTTTATQFDTHSCLDCGAVTDTQGRVRQGRGNQKVAPKVKK